MGFLPFIFILVLFLFSFDDFERVVTMINEVYVASKCEANNDIDACKF